jgi:hypothetical protein
MPRRKFGFKREEVTGGWKKLHNDKVHNLYSSQNIKAIKSRVRWVGYVAYMKAMRNSYKILVGGLEGKR